VCSGSRAAEDIVELLIRCNAQINAKDRQDATPLHSAAAEGSANLVRILLARGADIEARDCGFRTPLHDAACCGHHAVVDVLLSNGADVGAKDGDGMTGMHWVAISSRPSLAVLEALLSHEADVNAKERRDHSTPLHLAAARQKGATELVDFLVNHGSAINTTDLYGRTPLQLAHKNRNDETESLLRRLGGQ